MRKTKIICTLGPATDKGNVLEQLILSGMNVARLNFSHDTYENQKKRIDKVKALRTKHHLPVACLLDTKGPCLLYTSPSKLFCLDLHISFFST